MIWPQKRKRLVAALIQGILKTNLSSRPIKLRTGRLLKKNDVLQCLLAGFNLVY